MSVSQDANCFYCLFCVVCVCRCTTCTKHVGRCPCRRMPRVKDCPVPGLGWTPSALFIVSTSVNHPGRCELLEHFFTDWPRLILSQAKLGPHHCSNYGFEREREIKWPLKEIFSVSASSLKTIIDVNQQFCSVDVFCFVLVWFGFGFGLLVLFSQTLKETY